MTKKATLSKILSVSSEDDNLKDLFQYNKYSKDIEFKQMPIWGDDEKVLTDAHIVQMKLYMDTTHFMDLHDKTIEDVCFLLASKKSYHPIKDYLGNLRWDGIKRCDSWLVEICNTEDNCYIRNVSKYVLIAAVNRIFNPGVQFDHMLILEGAQGGGKSTMLNILGGEWYLDTQLSTSENKKDLIDVMRTGWIIEIADLAGFRKHEVDFLRSFITRKIDRVRLAYGRRAENFRRQCVFIGTHNPSGDNQYFKDDTGNRRFWPVQCNGMINNEKMRSWRDQLWAEAVVMYKNKEQYYLTDKESLDILDELHKEREIDIPIYEKIGVHLKNVVAQGKTEVTIEEILTNVFKISEIGKLSYSEQRSKVTMIGIYMRKAKWRKGNNQNSNTYYWDDYSIKQKDNWDE